MCTFEFPPGAGGTNLLFEQASKLLKELNCATSSCRLPTALQPAPASAASQHFRSLARAARDAATATYTGHKMPSLLPQQRHATSLLTPTCANVLQLRTFATQTQEQEEAVKAMDDVHAAESPAKLSSALATLLEMIALEVWSASTACCAPLGVFR